MSISVSFLEVSILCSGFVCFVFWLEIHIISLLSASTLSPVIKNKGGQLDWEGCWGQPTTDGKYDGGVYVSTRSLFLVIMAQMIPCNNLSGRFCIDQVFW